MAATNIAPTLQEPGQAAKQKQSAAIPKKPLFLMNYSRPTYKSTVKVSYFWNSRLPHGGIIKVRMY
jgi:hypothetical protein